MMSKNKEITREIFCDSFSKNGLDDLFFDALDGKNFLELEDFTIYYDYDGEQMYIINKSAMHLTVISWYKWMHVGRSLEIVGIESRKELDKCLKLLAKNLLNIIKR